jgi:hypothetical protein
MQRIYQMLYRKKDGSQSHSCYHECDEEVGQGRLFIVFKAISLLGLYAIMGDVEEICRVRMRMKRLGRINQVL